MPNILFYLSVNKDLSFRHNTWQNPKIRTIKKIKNRKNKKEKRNPKNKKEKQKTESH